MTSHRVERTAEQIQHVVSGLLERRIGDPRLAMINVTRVKLSPTMREATIYVSAMDGAAVKDDVLAGLEHAHGFLRREVAQHLQLRNAPELYFKWDDSVETGDRVLGLLDELKEE